jgi:hypothetical protein
MEVTMKGKKRLKMTVYPTAKLWKMIGTDARKHKRSRNAVVIEILEENYSV